MLVEVLVEVLLTLSVAVMVLVPGSVPHGTAVVYRAGSWHGAWL
jgi:hypothetical protein